MSRAHPDLVRLKIDGPKTGRQHAAQSVPILAEKEEKSGNYATQKAQGNQRHQTLSPRFAEMQPPWHESPSKSGVLSQATSRKPNSEGHSSLRPAPSSASVSSQKSQRTGAEKSSRHLTPVNSVLELKRFFGKGRTKHEHGVRSNQPDEKKRPRSTFSLFSLGKKKNSSSPSPSSRSSPAPSILNRHGADGGHHKEHSDAKNHKHFGKKSDKNHRSVADLQSPIDYDPNFIVHGPDYEAEWDPFHIFGLNPNSERLPFLESGITKYGEIGRDMGSGAGGSVRMMERPSDNKVFAVKEFRARRPTETPQKYAKHMTAEYALGAALHHKNIIETIDLIKEGDKYYEVMEYGPYDFFEVVMSGGLTTPQINSSFRQILNGVSYLHSMGVAHRDLKLDNCVVTDEGVVKLIDFGSAVVFKYPMSPQIHLARGILGSDPYLAPEVFLKRPYQPQCADIWSCGIIYCCTYLRRFPWKLPQMEDTSFSRYSENPANIDGKNPPQDNPKKITGPWRVLRLLPKDSRELIASILTIPVNERATVDDIEKNPWFRSIEEISVSLVPQQTR